MSASARGVAWPAKGPVPLELRVDLPVAGTLSVDGTADLAGRAITLTADLKDAALASGALTEDQFNEWVVPLDMTHT